MGVGVIVMNENAFPGCLSWFGFPRIEQFSAAGYEYAPSLGFLLYLIVVILPVNIQKCRMFMTAIEALYLASHYIEFERPVNRSFVHLRGLMFV